MWADTHRHYLIASSLTRRVFSSLLLLLLVCFCVLSLSGLFHVCFRSFTAEQVPPQLTIIFNPIMEKYTHTRVADGTVSSVSSQMYYDLYFYLCICLRRRVSLEMDFDVCVCVNMDMCRNQSVARTLSAQRLFKGPFMHAYQIYNTYRER